MGTPSMEPDQEPATTSRVKSPATEQLRHRQNASTGSNVNGFAPLSSSPGKLRRSSTFSEAVSETRRSIKSSTDDLFFPRANISTGSTRPDNTDSPWHSSPLLLALLPGLGGLLFHNGAAVFTDVALLSLAAVFLNWSVRLPWEWYFAAQERVRLAHDAYDAEDLDDSDAEIGSPPQSAEDCASQDNPENEGKPHPPLRRKKYAVAYLNAKRELQTHELSALASCFLFPVLAAYLLHYIRFRLSRPSEGLVSNYSLTLFLLAAEIRPVSHLLKMVQARTLYLQRVVESSQLRRISDKVPESDAVVELSKRLDDLESRFTTANLELTSFEESHSKHKPPRELIEEARKAMKSDIYTLDKLVRSQERRYSTISAKVDAHIRTIDSYMVELGPLATSGKRGRPGPDNGSKHSSMQSMISTICAIATSPLRIVWSVVKLPIYPFARVYHNMNISQGIRE
ncbi:hypothetical protein MGYG_07349 [Nannizzia gypsea CBS 118893]|uniref:Uncharacterized protein n=1 Tax=Arthroderma gypseum (strain ATCC MYA-4604 / CBS 118893) TaxID=535722 RepID=E4V2W6_ARTGP|nr:hypothetical protein MGYG_07349 [Nannizzia gypsea CBS 118893]EFR04340.1 hypothetical protein MGYG_07349 [Nannizzia gypsea CBS 118893]